MKTLGVAVFIFGIAGFVFSGLFVGKSICGFIRSPEEKHEKEVRKLALISWVALAVCAVGAMFLLVG